jgi:Uncharacterized conserved protein (DUF2075)
MMKRDFYSAPISEFQSSTSDEILGKLAANNPFTLETTQKRAWLEEISTLKNVLAKREGFISFEYSIPRMGKRIDVVLIVGPVIFVLEFKVDEKQFSSAAVDQVWDYALDLKNFHETSKEPFVAPILIATEAVSSDCKISPRPSHDKLLYPICSNAVSLTSVIDRVLSFAKNDPEIDPLLWQEGRYCPTPTIVEAAQALYGGHTVDEISRNDASAINLTATSEVISKIIHTSQEGQFKSICFVTGVPGAGKTLVGLNTATKHRDQEDSFYSVFLSGNGPLVAVLREALARDHVLNERISGGRLKLGEARRRVKAFIQNVHEFRDECLRDPSRPPIEHVAIFDEAQRAWNLDQTASFMRQKKGISDFEHSEPKFLISCLDRHPDWAVVVCLVGGGQEINKGEAGISEWIGSLEQYFPEWRIYVSSRLTEGEYAAGPVLEKIKSRGNITTDDALHLSVSMRSFRAENVSELIKQVLDLELASSQDILNKLREKYPIVITRDLAKAKRWLRDHARGSERYGILVSSQAERLRPHAIYVKSPVDPVHWFLDAKDDVRSSYYLEDVATEFHVQGLEVDWACVTWDADFRHARAGWEHWSFVGNRWNAIRKAERKSYQKNAYRVLLTRARQGMVLVIPSGDLDDPTRKPEYYDSTFAYLKEIGFQII